MAVASPLHFKLPAQQIAMLLESSERWSRWGAELCPCKRKCRMQFGKRTNKHREGEKDQLRRSLSCTAYISKFELSSGLVVHTVVQLGNGRTKERKKKK
jgi:hypothetical protein